MDFTVKTFDHNTLRCIFFEFPVVDYVEIWNLQHELVRAINDGIIGTDVILLLEHAPVFTLGRNGNHKHLLVDEAFISSQGAGFVKVERGGDITYHGPGQLVCYPIINLNKMKWKIIDFVEALEEIMIRTAGDWGVKARRNSINRGIWVDDAKLGSVGIAVRSGISFHGFALNVNTLLEPFAWINPCGLEGIKMTSMKRLLGIDIDMKEVRSSTALHIRDIFGVELENPGLNAIHLIPEIHIRQEMFKI